MTREKQTHPHRFHVPIPLRRNPPTPRSTTRTRSLVRARRISHFVWQLAAFFQSIDVPIRIQYRAVPLQRLERVGGVRLFGPFSSSPYIPPPDPISQTDEILQDDALSTFSLTLSSSSEDESLSFSPPRTPEREELNEE